MKFIQLSDLHITKEKNLLDPLIESINKDNADFVVITGDIVDEPKKELYEIATNTLRKINTKVFVLPGDYDFSSEWTKYFGSRFKSFALGEYIFDFLDTSFMGHKYHDGWSIYLYEDKEQNEFLLKSISNNKKHIIFSHHPFWYEPSVVLTDAAKDNVRAVFSGHDRKPTKSYFKYNQQLFGFEYGLVTVPLKFHGNSTYMLVEVTKNNELRQTPRAVFTKRTAW